MYISKDFEEFSRYLMRNMDGIIDLARALADQEIKQLRLDHEKTKSDLENTNVELSLANDNIQIQMDSLQKDLKVSTEKSENLQNLTAELQDQLKAKEDELEQKNRLIQKLRRRLGGIIEIAYLEDDDSDDDYDVPPPPKKISKLEETKLPKSLQFCNKVLREMLTKKHKAYAWPFYKPVDGSRFDDYHDIIKKPMDLETVKKKMDNRLYSTAEQFAEDVRQIFRNCYKYNPATHDVVGMARILEEVFETKFKKVPTDMDVGQITN